MNTKKISINLFHALPALILGYLFSAASPARAQILWTGPSTNYSQCVPPDGCTDQIIATVALNRGNNGPLYNSAPPYNETSSDGVDSPADTLWAFLDPGQTISNYASLSYQTFADIRNNANNDLAAVILNQPMVLQLINEQIYISIEFTDWPQGHQGGFTYTRSTPPIILLSAPKVSGSSFTFNYTASPGSTNVIQRSTNLTTWLPVATNVASANPASFTNNIVGNGPAYFRVHLLANP